jgi:hypothetical protein
MAKTAAQLKPDPLAETFDALKKIYKPFEKRLNVTVDNDVYYYLESKAPMYKGKPLCFGAVRRGKGKVSFHMMALYCFPAMKSKISAALKKRMQGKQCFNFATPDAALFAELSALAEEGARRFAGMKDFEAHVKGRDCDN